jgi:hypothetical protein
MFFCAALWCNFFYLFPDRNDDGSYRAKLNILVASILQVGCTCGVGLLVKKIVWIIYGERLNKVLNMHEGVFELVFFLIHSYKMMIYYLTIAVEL